MDSEALENKAKLMKKRTSPWTGEGRATQEQLPSLHVVSEHFEEVLTPLSGASLFVQRSI